MGGDGADPWDLVGRDGHAQPGAADQQGAVCLAFGDFAGGVNGDVRVCGRVVGADSHIHHGRDAAVRFEQRLQRFLVFDARFIVADDNAPSCSALVCAHDCAPFPAAEAASGESVSGESVSGEPVSSESR
ncbi:hypothetical protein D9M72_541390 [compost metagenome]